MERIDMLLDPVKAALIQVAHFLPKLAVALLVLLIGWVLARVVRFAVVKGLRAANFPVLTERAGLDSFLREGGIRIDTTTILGALVSWIVVVAALLIAFNGLDLGYVTDLLGRIAVFLPRLIVALLILVFGMYFARFAGGAVAAYCRGARIQDADVLGKIVRYTILAFVIVIALDQIGLGGDILRGAFLIVLAGVVLALALAFGLGGRGWARELLERWWPRHRRGDE
jgi:Mechanosensitive ion channel, conserved TM helix